MKLEQLVRPDLLDLKPYSSARDEYEGKEGVFLDANENPFDNGVNRYPDPLQRELKLKIGELKSIDVDQIFLGNGSDECIDLLIRLLCVSGKDKIVSISPSYGMYSVSAKINHIELVEVFLNEDFSLNKNQLMKNGKDAKIMFICSPNNPTGNVFSKTELISLLNDFKGILVIDEAYIDFSSEESMIGELINSPNLVVLQTFSKAYGLAGLRLGMLFASKELVSWLNKIKPPYNINQLTQEKAIQALENTDLINSQIDILKEERKRVETELMKLDLVLIIYKSDANFILVKVKDANMVYNKLIESKVIVRNRSNQRLCDDCVRITIGTQEENDVLITKMKEINEVQIEISEK